MLLNAEANFVENRGGPRRGEASPLHQHWAAPLAALQRLALEVDWAASGRSSEAPPHRAPASHTHPASLASLLLRPAVAQGSLGGRAWSDGCVGRGPVALEACLRAAAWIARAALARFSVRTQGARRRPCRAAVERGGELRTRVESVFLREVRADEEAGQKTGRVQFQKLAT